MKKIALLSFAIIALASCKKERTCTCETTDNEPGSTMSTKTIVFKKTSKGSAKAACMSIVITPDGQLTSTGTQFVETRKCTLK